MFLTKYIAEYCGGFKSNPIPYIANGPVWTLTWEVVCYFGLAILGSLGALHGNAFSGFYASVWLAYLFNLSGTSDAYLVIAPLLLMFLGGASIALMDNRLGSAGAFGVALGALLLVFDAQFFSIIYSWIVAHVPFLWGAAVTAEQAARVIYLAAFPIFIVAFGKNSRPAIKLKNDISYGVYIYGWPIAQTLVYVATLWKVRLTPGTYFLLTMLFVFPAAYLSWIFVERPCLALKKRFVI